MTPQDSAKKRNHDAIRNAISVLKINGIIDKSEQKELNDRIEEKDKPFNPQRAVDSRLGRINH